MAEADAAARGGLAAVAALNEPLRRRIYHYVAAQTGPVGRDEAAAAAGVARSVAAFHLDRLAEVGLVDVEFRRPPGRGGPGAGRPAKLYRRAEGEVSVSVPERRYDLAGTLLAHGIVRAEAERTSPSSAAHRVAHEYGQRLGRQAAKRPGPTGDKALDSVAEVLTQQGYEPRVQDHAVVLENCPFHALAEEQRDLVCAMNLELINGVVQGMGAMGVSARLAPEAGRCCVRVDRARR